jgi:hypothetical protein
VDDSAALRGTFDVVMVALTGERAGRSARGTMVLWRPDPATGPMKTFMGERVARPDFPAVGSLTIDADGIGLHFLGEPAATDPADPGVRVTPHGMVVVRDAIAMDAAAPVVVITETMRSGFRGRWTAEGTALVTPMPVMAEGYFCLIRAPSAT